MAVTTQECEEMIRAAKNNGRRLMIAYRLHFEQANLTAIDMARRGKLGELRFFSSEFAQQVVKENVRLSQGVATGGGPVYDMGVYCINAARYLFGDEPTQVSSLKASKDDARFQNARR